METVLIVGAGPTGLMLALCLSKQNIPFRIIDQKMGPSKHSKALGLQPRTLEILDNLGVVDPFLEKGNPIKAFNWYSGGKKTLHIDLESNLESSFKNILILPQSETEKLLIEQINGQVEWGKKLLSYEPHEEYISVQLEEETIETKWLMGCDGAHSQVRKQMGCAFEGDAVPHYFLLADVRAKWPFSQNELQIFFEKEGVMALFPLDHSEGWMRIVANMPNLPLTQETRAYSLDEVQSLFKERSELDISFEEMTWSSLFKVSYHVADKVQEGRVFLLGDAFHIHSPVGGQGMNTGMQDAYNLSWKLARVIKGQSPTRLLESYADERLSNAKKLIKVTRQTTKMIDLSNAPLRFLRSWILPHIVPLFQKTIANTIGQLRLCYPKNRFLQDEGPSLKERVGMRFSASPLLPKFHLFLYGDDPSFDEITTLVKDKLGADVKRCKGVKPALYLVRPDGVIGYRASPIKVEPLQEYITSLSSS
jgi:2-polyprenyl-6-methoxyphenol hydroxylase-like FAD-dependent oxidoreductase